jgi:hypothetical protein
MSVQMLFATAVTLPAHSAVRHAYRSVQLADAYAIDLPPGAASDPEVLGRFLFSHQPAWIGALMRLRDAIVALFGIKTAKKLKNAASGPRASRVGIFKVYSIDDSEMVMGEDDKHLDFRVSVLRTAFPGGGARLTVSTVVHCHNMLGHSYLLVIAPFHRMVVKAVLRRAAALGWPRTAA